MKRTFRHSLADGRYGEIAVARLFENAGIRVVSNDTIDYDLDCSYGGFSFRVEVKFDQMERTTGNIAIEYYNTRKAAPSGIGATKAELWATVLQDPQTIWLTSTKSLRGYISSHRPFREVANGGDDNAAMKLYPRDDILPEIFTRIDDIHPAELADTIRSLCGKATD